MLSIFPQNFDKVSCEFTEALHGTLKHNVGTVALRYFFCLGVCLFVCLKEKESGGRAEEDGEKESKAGSTLRTETDTGLDLKTMRS